MIHPRGHALPLLAAAFAAAFAVAALLAFRAARRVPDAAKAIPAIPAAEIPQPGVLRLSPSGARCVAPLGGRQAPGAAERFFADLRARFRLAGFRLNARNPGNSGAIIEDRDDGSQWMRRKGDRLTASIVVEGVGTNSVTLSTPHGACVLVLTRKGGRQAAAGAAPGEGGAEGRAAAGAAARLAGAESVPGTWHFRRDDVMAYFNEIKDRPERLEAVFDTLAPVWYADETDGLQKIEGYRVEICGEEDFFKAVGFREGDIVREVNGIRMTNRYAAEELIRRFVHDDLDFAHIRMERDGEEILQSYLIGK